MSLTSIVLHVDNSRAFPGRLAVALSLAARHEASLTGVYPAPRPGPGIYAENRQDIKRLEDEKRRLGELESAARSAFKDAVESAKLEHSWIEVGDRLLEGLQEEAGYADLLVLGQPDPGDPLCTSAGIAEPLMLESGRPVLIVPYVGGRPAVGQRVLVAWNGGPAARRAIHEALPILRAASQIDVVVINASPTTARRAAEASERMCGLLARHGVSAVAHHIAGGDMDIGEQLLSRASERTTDLLVMGGYDHSRLRERVLGGATRSVLQHMTVPVFMTH